MPKNDDRVKDKIDKPIMFKPYNVEKESRRSNAPRISVTQKMLADEEVNVPEIFVPDPLDVNPNTTINVEKVLLHIENITGIKDGTRKWTVVTCDGIPYHRMAKIKEKYPWNVPVPGQLHEEMNMLRAYEELNW